MKRLLSATIVALLFASPVLAGPSHAVDDATRLEEHQARDAGRKPKKVLALTGIKSGQKVADLAAGSGYYTALLSRIVGERGVVYAVDPVRIFEAFPNASKTFPAYLENDPRENIEYSVQKFDELAFPQPLDAVMMGLYYHDTVWTGVDRTAMNKAIFDALKPGGVYIITDHNAADGAGDDVTKSLHRMPKGVIKPEVLAAGFELAAESDALANADDRPDASVFDETLRGKTDRVVYVFRKP